MYYNMIVYFVTKCKLYNIRFIFYCLNALWTPETSSVIMLCRFETTLYRSLWLNLGFYIDLTVVLTIFLGYPVCLIEAYKLVFLFLFPTFSSSELKRLHRKMSDEVQNISGTEQSTHCSQ